MVMYNNLWQFERIEGMHGFVICLFGYLDIWLLWFSKGIVGTDWHRPVVLHLDGAVE